MDFGDVIKALRSTPDITFTREGWNGKGMFIGLVRPSCPMKLQYIVMCTATGHFVPWLASQTDMLADDWVRADSSERDCDCGGE